MIRSLTPQQATGNALAAGFKPFAPEDDPVQLLFPFFDQFYEPVQFLRRRFIASDRPKKQGQRINDSFVRCDVLGEHLRSDAG